MHVLNYHHSTLSFDARGEDDKFKYQCVNTLVLLSFVLSLSPSTTWIWFPPTLIMISFFMITRRAFSL